MGNILILYTRASSNHTSWLSLWIHMPIARFVFYYNLFVRLKRGRNLQITFYLLNSIFNIVPNTHFVHLQVSSSTVFLAHKLYMACGENMLK
ncbi:hypothetical protein ACJX0J_021640, partial [Zea mays]